MLQHTNLASLQILSVHPTQSPLSLPFTKLIVWPSASNSIVTRFDRGFLSFCILESMSFSLWATHSTGIISQLPITFFRVSPKSGVIAMSRYESGAGTWLRKRGNPDGSVCHTTKCSICSSSVSLRSWPRSASVHDRASMRMSALPLTRQWQGRQSTNPALVVLAYVIVARTPHVTQIQSTCRNG